MLLIASNQIIGQQALTEAELDLKPLPEMEGDGRQLDKAKHVVRH